MIHGIRVKSNWLNRGVCIFKVNELNSFYTYYFNRFRSRGASKENINNTGQGLAFFQPLSLPNNFCTVPWKLPRVSYVSHRAVQGALRTTGWRRREAEKVTFQFPCSSLSSLSILLRSFPHPLPLGVLRSPSHRETDHIWSRSHGAKHGASQHHRNTHTQRHKLVPVRPEMLPCGGTKEFSACSLFMHTAEVLDVQLSQ